MCGGEVEELAGQVVHRNQLIICEPRLSENALFAMPRPLGGGI